MKRFSSTKNTSDEDSQPDDMQKTSKKFMGGKRTATRLKRRPPPKKIPRKPLKRGAGKRFRPPVKKRTGDGSDSDEENYFFSKEWREMDRRQRRFTKSNLYELHEKAEEIKRRSRYDNEEREERLQEMDDILDEMEDYISDYRKKKEIELKKKDKGESVVLAKSWRKYPRPGSNPQVTFKPEHFLLRSGFLYKKGLKWHHWKKRFFRIFLDDPHTLRYYSSAGQAEVDASLNKRLRRGKKINLLFANIYSTKDKAKLFNKRKHKNKNIVNGFKLFIQTKTIKKLKNAKNQIEKKIILNRIYHLCCLSEIEFDNWYKTLKYVEEQTEKCIKEHESKIAKGLELKKLYFRQKKKQENGIKDDGKEEESNKPDDSKAKEADKKQELRDLAKYDRAQNIKAYGGGIKQAVAGEKSTFLIEDCMKVTGKKGKYRNAFNLDLLTVVLESNELHYDLEPVRFDKSKKYICQYLLTRKGEYELSIMYDGIDIYGSPMKLYVTPAKLSSTHTYLSGQKYLLATTQPSHLKVNFRNIFDERVGVIDTIGLDIQCSSNIEVINEDAINKVLNQKKEDVSSFIIQYVVKKDRDPEKGNETDWISVQIDDKIATPSFLRHVKNSPFSIQIIDHPAYVQSPTEADFALKNSPHQEQPIQKPAISTGVAYKQEARCQPQTEELKIDTSDRQGGYFTAAPDSSYMQGPSSRGGNYFAKDSLFSPSREHKNDSYMIDDSFTSPLPPRSVTRSYDKKVLRLFEQHETVMKSLVQHFGSDLSGVINLSIEYDIVPTFISKSELQDIYNKLPKSSGGALELDWFQVCLAQIAIFSLSKPMFAHLYSTDKSKVNVLLNMWGVADPSKISSLRQQQQNS